MANVGAVVSSIRNIMRQDRGISGDAQRLEQLGWMLFLKIIDDKDQELAILKDDYVSVIPEKFQWRTWAKDPEGITGDDLLEFMDRNAESNRGLFASLRNLTSITNPKRASIVKEVFDGSNNYMKSGYEMRKVINKLNEIDFNNSEDKHVFGDIYESILVELRDAGNKGEYYTPRAVTQLMTQMTDPKLGEKVLDPAAGTGGFLTAAIDHVREHYVNTVDDEHILQNNVTGWELKPVAYVLGLTNLILHEMDVPDYHYMDSLKKEYNSIGKKDQVDVILYNPPFGASIADGVETNFPATYRCKESADLFVILMLQLLKPRGRCAIVLPDGSISGDGVKARIREKLLSECNLHTIIRLPQSTFFPANVPTNLLFFEKGSKTNDIWYYEHKLPEGQKSYSKKKPIRFEEFQPIIDWWNNRKENEVAWKVNLKDLKNWDLDNKNPTEIKAELGNPKEHLKTFTSYQINFDNILSEIINEIGIIENETLNSVFVNHKYLFRDLNVVQQLKQFILQEAIKGELTKSWREQNPNNEPAIELLKRINEEKEQLIKDKKLKKEKPLPSISKEEISFDLPEGWIWCRLIEICTKLTDGFHHTPKKKNSGYKYISPKNLKNNKVIWSTCDFIDKIDHDYLHKKVNTTKGDILIANRGTVGTPAIVDIDEQFSFQNLALIGFNQKEISSKYIYYYILYKRKGILDFFANGGLQPMLSNKVLKTLPLPLPSFKEQIVIVEKVEFFMQKCDGLEQVIKTSESNAQLLMQAVLKEAFEGKKEEVEA